MVRRLGGLSLLLVRFEAQNITHSSRMAIVDRAATHTRNAP
jgi:hypothetical protein